MVVVGTPPTTWRPFTCGRPRRWSVVREARGKTIYFVQYNGLMFRAPFFSRRVARTLQFSSYLALPSHFTALCSEEAREPRFVPFVGETTPACASWVPYLVVYKSGASCNIWLECGRVWYYSGQVRRSEYHDTAVPLARKLAKSWTMKLDFFLSLVRTVVVRSSSWRWKFDSFDSHSNRGYLEPPMCTHISH